MNPAILLLFMACLGDDCAVQKVDLGSEPNASMLCAIGGQQEMVRWLREHPDYKIPDARYRCVRADRLERRA